MSVNDPHRRSRRRRMTLGVVAGAASAVVAAGGCSGAKPAASRPSATTSAPPTSGHVLMGTFTLWSTQLQASPCARRADYADVVQGLEMPVTNEAGVRVGSGFLSAGRADATRLGCVFDFTVRSLPDAASYTVGVGARGGLSFSAADLAKMGWRVAISLGTPPKQ